MISLKFILFCFIYSMSSEENIIAMPADNSIASDSISAKLIEVSRVAESLDTVLHETQDGLHIFESAMNATMTSSSSTAVDRKVSSGNTSDVRRNFLRRSQSLMSFFSLLGLEFQSQVIHRRRVFRHGFGIYAITIVILSYSVRVSRNISMDME